MTQYGYTPLSRAREIRLLKLHAGAEGDNLSLDLVHTALDEAPLFIALSYPWGELQPRKVIRCSGLLAEIGPNLHSALQHLREPGCDIFVWADALCINQEDIPERTQQVKMMGEIYAAASWTAIWLGEESDEIRMAFSWLRRFHKIWMSAVSHPSWWEDDSGFIPPELGRGMLEATFGGNQAAAFGHIWTLLDRPWFTRKWVIQELVKSREPLMVAGRLSRLPWAMLTSWMHFLELCLQAKELFMLCCPHANVLEAGTKILGMNLRRATILSQTKRTEGRTGILLFLVARTLTFRCADPRDHIFSLIGIASDANRFNLIDYESSIQGIWRQLSYTCVSDSMSLKLLWSLVPFTPLKHRVPSWLPNLESVLADGDGSIIASQFTVQQNRDHNTSGDSVLQASFANGGDNLVIRGRIVDSLQRAGSDHRSLGNSHTIHDIRFENDQASREIHQRILRHMKDRWHEECMDIAKPPGGGGGGGMDAFRDALLDGELMIDEFSQMVKVAKLEFSAQIGLYKAQTYAVNDHERSLFAALHERLGLKSSSFLDNIMMEKVQRRFGRTEKERLGWFPIVAEEGDLICIFDGMELPYAIRPAAEGRYYLVGECVIPGIMMGEAVLQPSDVDSEMIVLQ